MNLQDLIDRLAACDPATPVALGFHNPHSYRGSFYQVAFEPLENTTAGAMYEAARSALGATYQGYKGGDFIMDKWTTCNLANYGDCGETIGPVLLRYMLGEIK